MFVSKFQSTDNTREEVYHIVNIQNLPDKNPQEDIDESGTNHISRLFNTKIMHGNETLNKEHIYFESTSCGKSSKYFHGSGFLGAFLSAYNNHRDVILSPDDMWNMILMMLSKHVNENAEELREKFVSHEGQKRLTVLDWTAGNVEESLVAERNWQESNFFPQMLEQIRLNTKDGVVESLKADFSTTGGVDELFSIATIMDSFKKYFSYGRMIMLCGINNVRFMGTLDDWTRLCNKTRALLQYSLVDGDSWEKYVTHVLVILNQFVETYKGNVDVSFWNTIMTTEQERVGSGGQVFTKIQGWILHFFGVYDRVDLDDVPARTIEVPIKLTNQFTNTEKDLTLLGGFTGVHCSGDGAYRPQLGMVLYHFQSPKEVDGDNGDDFL